MYRFSDWLTSLRPSFWKEFYEHPELLSLFSHINNVLGAENGGYKLLENYDIVDIGEHNPGHTVSWVPITLGTLTYVDGDDYPYQYKVDDEWISMDCLHDKHIDPTVTLQNIVDFRLLEGTLRFIKFPPTDRLLVSKGLYAGTRLQDDFGKAFGYARQDSYHYRDTIVPLMAMFYKGPSVHNIVAAANVMINNPVAKYGDETIINTVGGDVITDRYRYNLGGAALAVNVGETITEHTPFADAIEFYTEKITPSWWVDRIARMFQKYKLDGTITPEQRDILMDTFLKYFVAHIRINLNKLDWRRFEFYPDVWDLILDGSPTRTDYILSMYYKAVDLDMPRPTFDVGKLRIKQFSIWGNRKVPGTDQWIYAPDVVTPVVHDDDTIDPVWYVGSLRYHVLDEGKKFEEFWSSKHSKKPYVEPYFDNWYGRLTDNPNIPMVSRKAKDSDIPKVRSINTRVVSKTPVGPNIISYIPKTTNVSNTRYVSVYGDQNIAHEDLDEWTTSGTVHLGIEGLVAELSSSGSAVSPAMNVGGIPKNIKVRVVSELAVNTSVTLYYKNNEGAWEPLPSDGLIAHVSNDVYFKVDITSSDISSPVFKGLDISIRL